MKHDLTRSREVLARTPAVLRVWLGGVSDAWVRADYGPGTFSPFEVVGHLLHGERADWIVRARWVLERGSQQPFAPFDRFAHRHESAGKSLDDLLDEFESLRASNLDALRELELDEHQLDAVGAHPALGRVTLRQLLATWVVHDLNHLAQIARAMAFQYRDEVGPWREYLPILPR